MNEHQDNDRVLTSTPLPPPDLPHLLDPGENLSDSKSDDRETPDFVVRLGTSLARSEAETQYKLLLKEFSLRPTETLKDVRNQTALTSEATSIRSSGRISPIRRRSSIVSVSNDLRRSSVVSISSESHMRQLKRGLGRLHRRRRLSARNLLFPLSPSPKEELILKEPAITRFRRVAKTVFIISGICLWLKRYTDKPDTRDWSFMEMYIHVRDDMNQLLAFNKNTYGKFEPLRDKLKHLLEIPKERRTLKNIQVIMALMRDNTSFQDYPVHTQIQLARCMQYQIYEARRVILKQGHQPTMFYIMLTGTAMVNIVDENPTTGSRFVRTVHELNAGDTFGEIAMLQGGLRTASIICKTTCEFLVVHKEDFDLIIKGPLKKQKEQHIEFCKSLKLFRDFPCDKAFVNNPNQFFYQYFKPDDVVVKDSRESKYIIVVKAGKCKIVGEFQERQHEDRQENLLHMFEPEIEESFPLYTTMKKIKAMDAVPKSDNKTNVQDTFQIGLLTGTIDRKKLVENISANKTKHPVMEDIRRRKESNESDTTQVVHRRHSADPHKKFSNSSKRAMSSQPRLADAPPHQNVSKQSPKAETVFTSYAQISELKAGQVFGLESLISTPSTRLSLVSEGAECILISKRLFLKEANVKVLRIVTDLVQNYPSHDYIKDQVFVYRRWIKYKAALEKEILADIKLKDKVWVGGIPVCKSDLSHSFV